MINTPSNGTVLSENDQNQVNLLENRLLTFRREIGDAKTEKETLEKEISQLEEDKKYKELLLADITKQVSEKKAELEHLNSLVIETQNSHSQEKERATNLKTESDQKEQSLSEREKLVTNRENILDVREATVLQTEKTTKEIADAITESKRVLLEAIDKAKW